MGQQGGWVYDLAASPLLPILGTAEFVHGRGGLGMDQAPLKISRWMELGWAPASAGFCMDLK